MSTADRSPYHPPFTIFNAFMTRPSRRTTHKPGRKPLTKNMLLPLPVERVRALSLENHLFLAAIRDGHGTENVAMNLLRVLYLAWFMRDAADDE